MRCLYGQSDSKYSFSNQIACPCLLRLNAVFFNAYIVLLLRVSGQYQPDFFHHKQINFLCLKRRKSQLLTVTA